MGDNYVSKPRWDKVGAYNYEPVGTIMKDPPRSITVPKFEPVEFGDVSYMIRENPDRFSESIRPYAAGVNAFTSMAQGDTAQGSDFSVDRVTSNPWFPTGDNSASTHRSPYAINKDGAFHLPIVRPWEDNMPLSRQRRPQPTYQTNPSLPAQSVQLNVPHFTDKQIIKGSIRPSVEYNMGTVGEHDFNNHILDPLRGTMTTHAGINLDTSRYPVELHKQILNAQVTPGGNHNWADAERGELSHGTHQQLNTAGMARPSYEMGTVMAPEFDPSGVNYNPLHTAGQAHVGLGGSVNNQFSTEPSTGIVIRPGINITTGMGSIAQSISVVNVNTQEVEQHIKDRPVIGYLSNTFNVAIKDSDYGYRQLELNGPEKIHVSVQADRHLPIQISQPDGKEIKLKDYTWSVVQTNPTLPATLVLEDMSRQVTQNWRRTPHYQLTARAGYRIREVEEINLPTLDRKVSVSVGALPSASIGYDRSMANMMLPERLQAGGFANEGVTPVFDRAEMTQYNAISNDRANLLKRAQRSTSVY